MDQDTINSPRKGFINYEQLLATVQSDLQSAFQNIEMLKIEKMNLAAQLAYERQIGMLCLQSVTDQLTRIGTMLDTGLQSPDGSLSLTDVQQTAFKTEINRLVKVLESEEMRLMEPLASRITENSGESTMDHTCLKPIDQNLNSKYQSTSVFCQKQIKPISAGMVRCFSAPIQSTTAKYNTFSWNPSDLGKGNDYVQILYSNDKDKRAEIYKNLPGKASNTELLSQSPSSSLHDLKIVEIQADGNFIRIANSSNIVDHEIGNYLLQQNAGGHPVAAFRFPGRVHCPALATVTVWSEGCKSAQHGPPSNFIFQGKPRWNTGPHISTILCRPNGQAIAWSSFLPNQYYQHTAVKSEVGTVQQLGNVAKINSETSYKSEINGPLGHANPVENNSVYINKPWNHSPNPPSSKERIRRSVIPGLPFAGAPGQRLGSASLRRYHSRPFSSIMP